MPFDGKLPGGLRQQSVIVLNELEKLLDGGKNWTRGQFHKENRFCMSGGLRYIRAQRKPLKDRAGVYLASAIRELLGCPLPISKVNDFCSGFESVKELIDRAQELALGAKPRRSQPTAEGLKIMESAQLMDTFWADLSGKWASTAGD